MSSFFKVIFTLITCNCLLSCNSGEKQSSTKPQVAITKTELEFQHGEHLISNASLFWKKVGKDSLVLWEGRISRDFFLFNLQTNTISKLLSFDEAGPNFMEENISDFEQGLEHYYILSQNYLHISDKEGVITKRVAIDKIKTDLKKPKAYKVHRIQPMGDDKLLVGKKLLSADLPSVVDEPQQSIFGVLDLKTDSISDLPIYSPEETLVSDITQGYYSNLSDHFFILKGDRLVFNYTFSPSIYEYNLTENTTKVYSGKTERFPNRREPFPANKYTDYPFLIEHVTHGIYFSSIGHDPKTGLSFRVATSKTQDELGENKVEKYLQVFNKSFELVEETPINTNSAIIMNASDNCIYMVPSMRQQQEEGKTKIIKYEISLK